MEPDSKKILRVVFGVFLFFLFLFIYFFFFISEIHSHFYKRSEVELFVTG